jgi:uncharacterized protein YjdB
MNHLKRIFIVLFLTINSLVSAKTYYVSPTGDNTNDGLTTSTPWLTWQYAFNSAVAGDIVYFRGGTYATTVTNGHGLTISKSGTSGNYITFEAYPADYAAGIYPILDCAASNPYDAGWTWINYGIVANSVEYVNIKGLRISNVKQKGKNARCIGITLDCPYHVKLENMVINNVDGHGYYTSDELAENKLYVEIINCDAYDMVDLSTATPGDWGTGFGTYCLYITTGYTYLHGCRAWNCTDQGFSDAGTLSLCVYDNCWAYDNGKYVVAAYGEGSGFKLGYMYGTSSITLHQEVRYCIAAHNEGQGFNMNDNNASPPPIRYIQRSHIYNNFAYHNGYGPDPLAHRYGFIGFAGSEGQSPSRIFRNNAAWDDNLGPFRITGGSYTSQNNSWDGGVTCNAADFQSLDYSQLKAARKTDGSLPDITFGKLVVGSDLINTGTTATGLSYSGAAPDIGAFEYSTTDPGQKLVTSIIVTGAGGASMINTNKGTLQLAAAVLPSDASNKTVTWSVANGTGQATISSSGLLTAVSDGTVTARATANDGSGVYGTLVITISNQVIAVTSITISGGTAITIDGGTLQLTASVLPANATNKTVTWSISGGSAYATINASTGLLTAVDNGSVTVRATAADGSGVFGTTTVTISNQVIPVTSITASGAGGATTITTDNGTLQLNTAVLPSNATNKTVTWSITNGSSLATVNSTTGLVTAIDNGIITVRATANDGSGVYGTLVITISNQVFPVASITVTGAGGATTITTDNGTLQLNSAVLPSNATNKTVTWSITNGSNLASINTSTGLVTATDNGIITVRATANDGSGVYGSLIVTISNQVIPVASITVTGVGGATSIFTENGTLQLNVTVSPSTASNKNVTWSISNGTGQATINSTGLVTSIDNGTVIARATANDGSGIYGTLTITISNQDIPVASIIVTGSGGASSISVDNGSLQLSSAVLPANATNKAVTWSITSGSSLASINSTTGLLMAIDDGIVTVRATANDGSGVYGTLIITISNQVIPVTSITVTGNGGATSITVEGGSLQLSSAILPVNATNKTVTWSITSGSNLASINATTGLVTAIDNGNVTVRATANDGSGIYGALTITISYISNSPPVIVVNYSSSSYSGFVSEINASGSYDTNKDNLTYAWAVPNNIPVSSTTGSTIKYLSPIVNSSQTVEFTLRISDGKITQSKVIPIEILPYKPELEVAEISNIEASSFQPPYYPYNILDGNIGTMWSANGDNQWLIVELKHSYNVQHVKIAFQPGQKRESYFDILGSVDKVTWEPILSKYASCAFSGDVQIFEFPPSKTGEEFNYIKLVGLGNSTDTWNYISELKIFGYRHRSSLSYEKLAVKIYPNPAKEFITLRIDEPTLIPDFVQITNLSGSVVVRNKVDPYVKEFTIAINLKKGIYIVQLGSGSLTLFTQKLVVAN